MKTKNRIIVSAVIVSKDNKVLLGMVRKGGVYEDSWHIPGGGAEEGETKEETLVREIKEEVGLDISNFPKKLICEGDKGQAIKINKKIAEKYLVKMTFFTYKIELNSDAENTKISLNDDINEYKWVSIDELKNYKHTPPSQKLFSSLGWV